MGGRKRKKAMNPMEKYRSDQAKKAKLKNLKRKQLGKEIAKMSATERKDEISGLKKKKDNLERDEMDKLKRLIVEDVKRSREEKQMEAQRKLTGAAIPRKRGRDDRETRRDAARSYNLPRPGMNGVPPPPPSLSSRVAHLPRPGMSGVPPPPSLAGRRVAHLPRPGMKGVPPPPPPRHDGARPYPHMMNRYPPRHQMPHPNMMNRYPPRPGGMLARPPIDGRYAHLQRPGIPSAPHPNMMNRYPPRPPGMTNARPYSSPYVRPPPPRPYIPARESVPRPYDHAPSSRGNESVVHPPPPRRPASSSIVPPPPPSRRPVSSSSMIPPPPPRRPASSSIIPPPPPRRPVSSSSVPPPPPRRQSGNATSLQPPKKPTPKFSGFVPTALRVRRKTVSSKKKIVKKSTTGDNKMAEFMKEMQGLGAM